MFLAVGTAHLYFTATATGEGFNNFITNLMTGCSASLALLCALSEPISEWNEGRTSTASANTSISRDVSAQNCGLFQLGEWCWYCHSYSDINGFYIWWKEE